VAEAVARLVAEAVELGGDLVEAQFDDIRIFRHPARGDVLDPAAVRDVDALLSTRHVVRVLPCQEPVGVGPMGLVLAGRFPSRSPTQALLRLALRLPMSLPLRP